MPGARGGDVMDEIGIWKAAREMREAITKAMKSYHWMPTIEELERWDKALAKPRLHSPEEEAKQKKVDDWFATRD